VSSPVQIGALRAALAALDGGLKDARGALAFGDARIDQLLGGAGLPLGRWHEAAGEGLEGETGVAAGAFVACLAARLADRGAVVWAMRRTDLYAPGLAGLGFPAERLIQVRVRDDGQALAVLEEALGSVGVAAAIAEVAHVDLLAGRRLTLACEVHGATGFIIRRRPFGGGAQSLAKGSAYQGAAGGTRWRIAPAPSVPAAGEPGLGAPRWRLTLDRAPGGRTGAWIVEFDHGPYPLRVVAELADSLLASPQPRRAAG
jgi:protein ImuA